ncbi:MAG: peptide-methionine (S)-S-oxide reductase MsrA [Candidatus Kerfeldbacteria bacterium]|nr:peptide-methionine (S)-S-oxide reductase MsrA [Candidatus Kerfeldbacteria bacterium]
MTREQQEVATFGSGCFWCSEAVFKDLKGVMAVTSGYSGGQRKNPSYEEVCSGSTGHAEVIQVEFDPSVISYEQLLEVFFLTHNPTQMNRQGNDVGTQYRSVIFCHNEDQKVVAAKVQSDLENQHVYDQPIVTAIEPFKTFYPAEAYHQNFYVKNPDQAYCQVVIDPKVAKFRQKFKALLKA